MSKNRKSCIFCGGFGLSKEHVFSKWTYALVPNAPTDSHARGHFTTSCDSPRVIGIAGLLNSALMRLSWQ